MRYKNVGKGNVQRQAVSSSNIYDGMVTRNLTEHTYTTAVDGTGVAVHPQARTTTGPVLRSATPTFSARQPKGMTLRTSQGTQTVHTTTKA